jgi:putative ABC transport system permease protein
MTDKEFRIPGVSRFLLGRFIDADTLGAITEDLGDRFQATAEESGEFKARLKIQSHIFSLLISLLVESISWRLTILKSYFKMAFRQILRQKGYSFINIAGLTVGLACFILIGLWVQDELCFDRFHENKERIFRILNQVESGEQVSTPTYAIGPALKDLYPEVEEFSRTCPWYGSLVKAGDRQFEEDNIYLADPGFFRMFSFPFIHGDPETALDARDAIVITEETALRYFGKTEAVGRVLYLAQPNADFKVTGVIKNLPVNSHMQFDLITRIELLGEDRLARWEEWSGPNYILLRPDAEPEVLAARIKDIYKENVEPDVTFFPVLQPLTKVYLYESGSPVRFRRVALFALIAIFILVMACVNFMNLATARSVRRAKEVGMRKVIGAVRVQVIRQFLGEAILVVFISLLFALILVEVILPPFNRFTVKSLTLFSGMDLSLILALIVTTLVTGFLAGSYPAFFLSSFQPAQTLKKQSLCAKRGSGIRKALIIFQFAISVGLVTCTLLVSQQLRFIQEKELGFNRENVVMLSNNPILGRKFGSFKNTLLTKPGIHNVTSAAKGPTQVSESIFINWEGNPSDDFLPIDYTVVDYDYFEVFGMEVTQGRSFSPDFTSDVEEACVISETAMARMGMEDPIGTEIYMSHPAWPESFRRARIIGVVKDFHSRSLHTAIRPFVFRMYRPWHFLVFIKIENTRTQEALAHIEEAFKTYAEDYPYRYMFFTEAYNQQYVPEQQVNRLFNGFSLLSILIACLGLLGLAAYTAEQKTKEIGIRKVMGASISGIVLLTTKDFLKWVAVSFVFAWPVAYLLMSQWLREFAYRISIGPLVFFLSAVLTLLIALLTVSFQSLKAALADPIDSLRYE